MLFASLVYKQKGDLPQAMANGNLFPVGQYLLSTYYVLGVWHQGGDMDVILLLRELLG